MHKILVLFAALLALAPAGCASRSGPPLDKIPPFVNREHVHFVETDLEVGDPAPDFTLETAHGDSQVSLSALRGKPVVLVFGSYT